MTDKHGLRPEDWEKAEVGFQSILSSLENAGFDLEKSDEMEISDKEEQRRGLPASLVMVTFRIGMRIEFEEVHELNGELHKEVIDCVVVGVFFDGFAFRRIQRKKGK